jgi:hypothetical protein
MLQKCRKNKQIQQKLVSAVKSQKEHYFNAGNVLIFNKAVPQ